MISRAHFFLALFFRVTHVGLSQIGTIRSHLVSLEQLIKKLSHRDFSGRVFCLLDESLETSDMKIALKYLTPSEQNYIRKQRDV